MMGSGGKAINLRSKKVQCLQVHPERGLTLSEGVSVPAQAVFLPLRRYSNRGGPALSEAAVISGSLNTYQVHRSLTSHLLKLRREVCPFFVKVLRVRFIFGKRRTERFLAVLSHLSFWRLSPTTSGEKLPWSVRVAPALCPSTGRIGPPFFKCPLDFCSLS